VSQVDAAAEVTALPPELRADALFLVWGPPSHGPRSQVFAREIGVEIRFVTSTRRRGAITAPARYASMWIKTMRLLSSRRPRLVFVQSPPTFAVLAVWWYCSRSDARFVVDAHSAAMLARYWTRPASLYRQVARRALATIVTNEHFARRIRQDGGRALVIPDIPTSFPIGDPYPIGDGFHVMVVSSFAPDEPLPAIVSAARELDDVVFHVTGDPRRPGAPARDRLPENVRMTGFLPDPAYYALMSGSHAVMCLTTRDHTMQRGACEALWVGTPIVTSRWPLLQQYFNEGTVHVGSTAEEIRDGVRAMIRHHARYARQIEHLRSDRRRAWRVALGSLTTLLQGSHPEQNPRSKVR
jgi:glycosyltransferase involved in cell wall biosynthesis